jgi:hypothetical protein
MPERTVSAAAGALRVRPPHPLAPSARLVLVGMGLVVLVIGGLVLRAAVADDEARGIRGQELDALLAPAGSTVDGFAGTGPLGPTDEVPWTVVEGSWIRDGGMVASGTTGANVALVDTGHRHVVVDAKVVATTPGSGLVVADAPGDRVELVVDRQGTGWQVVRTRGGTRQLLQLVPGPTADVTVQVVRRPDLLTVAFDGELREVALAGGPLTGTSAGLVADGGGTRVDRFAYLPLDPG